MAHRMYASREPYPDRGRDSVNVTRPGDSGSTNAPSFIAVSLPPNILEAIGHYLVESDGAQKLNCIHPVIRNVHTHASEATISTRKPEKLEDVVRSSSKVSHDLFSFRLSCKSWANAGLNVYIKTVLQSPRYAQYRELNLPLPRDRTIHDLTRLFKDQPALSQLPTLLVIHVLPGWLPEAEWVDGFLDHIDQSLDPSSSMGEDHYRNMYEDVMELQEDLETDGGLMLKSLLSDMPGMKALSFRLSPYWDWMASLEFNDNAIEITETWLLDLAEAQAALYELFVFNWANDFAWTRIDLDGNTWAFVRQLISSDTASSRNLKTENVLRHVTNVTLKDRTVDSRIPEEHMSRESSLSELETLLWFLRQMPQLTKLTLCLQDQAIDRSDRDDSEHWLFEILGELPLSHLRSVSLARFSMRMNTLIGFLDSHRSTLKCIELVDFMWDPDYENGRQSNDELQELILFLRDMSLETVSLRPTAPPWFAVFGDQASGFPRLAGLQQQLADIRDRGGPDTWLHQDMTHKCWSIIDDWILLGAANTETLSVRLQ